MGVQSIPEVDLDALFNSRSDSGPSSSLRASADAFEAMGRTFDADFARGMIAPAELCPPLYQHWARQMRARVARFTQDMGDAA